MSARLAASLLVGVVLAAFGAAHAQAVEGDSSAQSDPDLGQVAAAAASATTGGQLASGASVSKPVCTWERYNFEDTAVQGAGVGPVHREAGTDTLVAVPSQATETLFMRWCPGGSAVLVWVSDGVDEDVLIASARQRVSAQVPVPVMDMNPEPAVGGIVNIGLWLAVVDPGQVSITASVGPVWATVTARYERTVWEMGNGDVVECDGVGTPIVDWETPEQGPCGYTYGWPSAPKFTGTDDLAYHAAVTGHWVVSFATSSGRAGSLSPIARRTDFLYQVREIQTLRVAEDG